MTNIINKLILKLILWYINYRLGAKFNQIKQNTILQDNVNLNNTFNHIHNAYKVELQENGLKGVWQLRKSMLKQLDSLNFGMFHSRHKTLSEINLFESLKYLTIFKDILLKIKYTAEVLILVKTILSFLVKAASIPLLALSVYIIIKRVLVAISLIFTSTFTAAFFSNYFDHISKLEELKSTLRLLSIRTHNYLFNDDLVSSVILTNDKARGISNNWYSWYNQLLDKIPSYNIDWSLVGYTTGGLLLLTTTYLLWSGTIEPSSLGNGLKKIGSFIWGLIFTKDDDDDDNTSDSPTGTDNKPSLFSNFTSEPKSGESSSNLPIPREEDRVKTPDPWEDSSLKRKLSPKSQFIMEWYNRTLKLR